VSDKPINAVDRRLKMLSGLWMEFAELADARLLRWCVTHDANRIVETFLEVHKEDPDGVPHLFFFSETPFATPETFADELVAWFEKYYEDNREGIIEEGGDASWTAPPATKKGPERLVQVLASFQKHYADLFDILALALIPNEIAKPAAWAEWWSKLLALDLPASVRFLIVDDVAAPAFDALAKAQPKRMVTQTPDIDMPTIYRELLKEGGGSGPGAAFRKQLVEISLAGQAGDVPAAKKRFDAAFAIAVEHKWPQMQFAAQMALAGIVFGAGDKALSLDLYRQAAAVAEGAAKAGDAVAPKLLVQAKMAEASVLFGDQKLREAGEIYVAAAPLAEAAGDAFLAMENYRMAAYCLEQVKDAARSWANGVKALDAAAKLTDDARGQSLLHHVGHGLVRLTKQKPFASKEKDVRQRLAALAGPDWEKRSP
jgi:hypothetical protein